MRTPDVSTGILNLFQTKKKLAFHHIEQAFGLRSNHVAYYLKKLITSGILQKNQNYYQLAPKTETLLPYLSQQNAKLPVVVLAIQSTKGIAFIQRTKRPYQNYWALPGGKILFTETIEQAARRIAAQEAGVALNQLHTCAIIDEHLTESSMIKNSWFLFFMRATTHNQGNGIRWMKRKDWSKEHVIPSDIWMLGKHAAKTVTIRHIRMQEYENTLHMTV